LLKISLLGSIMLAFILPTTSFAVTLYKWVDDEGNISYQDTPPPAGQNYEEKSFSNEGARTGDTNTEISMARAARENPIKVYTAQNCESCDRVIEILESNNVPFETIEVDTDFAAQKALIELVGSMRVPALAIGDKLLEAANRATIEDALTRSGYPEARKLPQ